MTLMHLHDRMNITTMQIVEQCSGDLLLLVGAQVIDVADLIAPLCDSEDDDSTVVAMIANKGVVDFGFNRINTGGIDDFTAQ